MAYDDNHCPCGGKKERGTMICPQCQDHLASDPNLAAMTDPRFSWEARRSSAIRILGMARGRNERLPLAFS
jgi:hypothetical protein